MDIKVIGEGCADCNKLYDNVKIALGELGIETEVEKVEDLVEMVKLGVMTAPSVMAKGKLIVSGRVASPKQIVEALKKVM